MTEPGLSARTWSKPFYLVDQSIMSHYWNKNHVKHEVDSLAKTRIICSSSVTMDEARFSARNKESLVFITKLYSDDFLMLHSPPRMDEMISEIRTALWDIGAGRGAQFTDVSIAAVAIHYGATVVHNDTDFVTIGRAVPELSEMRITV